MIHPEIAKAERMVREAQELVGEVRASIAERNRAEYKAAGGCLSCMGTGEVRVFDTYYDCSQDHSRMGDLRYGGDGPQHEADQRLLDDAQENLAVANETLRTCIKLHSVDAGVTVRVVKGRKLATGTVGVVTGLYHGQWGTRVGIRVDGEPKPLYTSIDNVLAISERFDGANDLPDLYGTPRQVSWAIRLRETAIKSGRITVERAREIREARYWIDNRPGADAERAA